MKFALYWTPLGSYPRLRLLAGLAVDLGRKQPLVHDSSRSVQEPFYTAWRVLCFLRCRRRSSVAPARLDRDYAPYARMRS
jgi:hypothetical protein